jgi:hypothetical protein
MVCAVMSVTLLLVALADKTKQVQRPVEMILDMLMTGLFTQVTKIWIPLKQTSKPHSTTYQPGQGQKVLRYPLRKQYPCTYAKKGPIVISHTDPVLRLKGQRLEISNTHKILGLTFDISHLIWKTHIDKVRTKTLKRLNVLKNLARMEWGAYQEMLLRVHEMLVLSALEYGNVIYGSARDGQLKRLEPMHNKGLNIAIRAFCVCKTENLLPM